MAVSDAPTAEAIVRAFALRLRLARSAELALAGSLFKAEELLMPDGSLPGTAEELDLLARILVRQKRYAEAEKRWKDALRVSEGKRCYQDSLDALNAYVIVLQHRKQILLLSISILSLILTIVIGFRLLK